MHDKLYVQAVSTSLGRKVYIDGLWVFNFIVSKYTNHFGGALEVLLLLYTCLNRCCSMALPPFMIYTLFDNSWAGCARNGILVWEIKVTLAAMVKRKIGKQISGHACSAGLCW